MFEAVDVISLIKGEKDYDNNLNLTVGAALLKRTDVSWAHPNCLVPVLIMA